MASRLKQGGYNDFVLSLPNKLDIKTAVKSLCHSYKNGAISEDNFNQIMKSLIAVSIENDIVEKLFIKSHRFDEKISKRSRL